MSFKAVASVLDVNTGSSTLKLILIMLADHASDDGERIYPSLATIAKRAEVSERTVRYALRELTAMGIIEVVQERAGKTTIYRIPRQTLPPAKSSAPATVAPPPRQSTTKTPATVAPEPIKNLSIEPINSENKKNRSQRFQKPTVAQVAEKMKSMGFADPESESENFHAYWESKGWKRGNAMMVSWESTLVTWKHNMKQRGTWVERAPECPPAPKPVEGVDWERRGTQDFFFGEDRLWDINEFNNRWREKNGFERIVFSWELCK